MEVVNEFLVSLGLHAWLLFDLLACLCLSLWVLSLLFFQVFPPSQHGGSEQVAGRCWVAGSGQNTRFLFKKKTPDYGEGSVSWVYLKKQMKSKKWHFIGQLHGWNMLKPLYGCLLPDLTGELIRGAAYPFCVQTLTGLTQLVHFVSICW